MNAKDLFGNLLTGIVQAAGAGAANSPQVQGAITQAQQEYEKLQTVAWVASSAAALTFIFFVLPRMENPVPRVLRNRR